MEEAKSNSPLSPSSRREAAEGNEVAVASNPPHDNIPNSERNNDATTVFFDSPRLRVPDSSLFPSYIASDSGRRRTYLQNLAGPHRQLDHVLVLSNRRILTPATLRAGMPRQAAMRITELHLHLTVNGNEEIKWDEWLDAIADMFGNLKHLYLVQGEAKPKQTQTDSEDDSTSIETIKEIPSSEHFLNTPVERIDVMKRLSQLISLNGKEFTQDAAPLITTTTDDGVKRDHFAGSLLDQDGADDDEENENDDSLDLDSTSNYMKNDDQAGKDRLIHRFQTLGLDEIKEDKSFVRTPKPLHGRVEVEYVSPETAAVNGCEWGVACANLSIPSYFNKSNGCGNRLGLRPRGTHRAVPSTGLNDKGQEQAISLKNIEREKGTEGSTYILSKRCESSVHSTAQIVRLSNAQAITEPRNTDEILSTDCEYHSQQQETKPSLPGEGKVSVARTPGRASLSSPFPMQFRDRARKAIFPENPTLTASVMPFQPRKEATSRPLSPTTVGGNIAQHAISQDTEQCSSEERDVPNPDETLKTIPVVLKVGRPPQCPTRRMSPTAVTMVKQKLKIGRGTRWREKNAARSNSIIDDSHESDDDSTASEDDEETLHGIDL
jgi:hypothetical protein